MGKLTKEKKNVSDHENIIDHCHRSLYFGGTLRQTSKHKTAES